MDRDYWLGHCEGFRVDSPAGHVGTVENVVYETAIDKPSALLVTCGILGRRLVRFEIDDVLDVDPSVERVCLRSAPVPVTRRIGRRLVRARASVGRPGSVMH